MTDALKLAPRQGVDAAPVTGQPFQRFIVEQDRNTVGTGTGVGLEVSKTGVDGSLKRRRGVFVPVGCAAAVSESDRPRIVQVAVWVS